MAGNNIHSQITDQAEIHVPKGFTEAPNHTALTKSSAGQLIWRDLDSMGETNNFTGTIDPTVSNDDTQGYTPGSRWVNTVSRTEFTCVDATTGAAVWRVLIRNNFVPSDPTIADDISRGFSVGSVWVDSLTNEVWICARNDLANAEWKSVTDPDIVGLDHRTLSHMVAPADDHTQYLHIDGRRAMTGDLNMGSQSIDNALQVNGIKIPTANVLRVTLNPGSAEYASVAAAVTAAGALATPSSPYLVQVAPGTFTEAPFMIPAHVALNGSGNDVTIITTNDPDAAFITLQQSTTISNLQLVGANGAGGIAINFAPTVLSIRGLMDRVRFVNCTTMVSCVDPAVDCVLILYTCDSQRAASFTTGVKVQSSSSKITLLVTDCVFTQTTLDPTATIIDISGTTVNAFLKSCYFEFFQGVVGTHVSLYNGASLTSTGMILEGGGIGLSVPNVGAAPQLHVASAVSVSPAVSASILHTSATGSLEATASVSSSVIVNPLLIAVLILDPNGNTYTSGALFSRQPDSTFTDITTLTGQSSPTGLFGSGDINPPVSGLMIDIEAGFGYVQKLDGSLHKIMWPDTPATIPANSTQYLYFDANSTLQMSPTQPDYIQNVIVGRVVTNSTDLLIVDESGFIAIHAASAIGQALRNGIGAVYSSGSNLSEGGTRNINVTPGIYYFGERKYTPQGGNALVFTSFYQDGLGGYTNVPGQTVVDNAFFDDGTGTLAPIGAGNYAKHSIYLLGDSTGDTDSEKYFLVYSQVQYTALTLAEQGSLPNPPNFLSEGVALIASIIVQQGQTHFSEVRDERPIISSKRSSTVAATTFHSNLLGLTVGDDHPQYWRNDGTHVATGDFNLGTHNITNLGTANGVVVENHHARHQPGGADAIPTGIAVTLNPDLSNAIGSSSNLSRSDHVHNVPTATAVTLDSNSTNTQGVSTSFARADHTHAITWSAPVTQNTDQSNSAGTAAGFSRADHVHNIPTAIAIGMGANTANSQGSSVNFARADHQHAIGSGPASTQTPNQANATGTGGAFARQDHVHNIPTGIASGLNAGSTNTQGAAAAFAQQDHTHAIASGTPVTQNPDQTNTTGTSTNFARADHIHNVPTAAAVSQTPNQSNAVGASTSFARADHIHNIPTGIASGLNANSTNTQGSAAAFAQQDHTHAIASGAPITQNADQANSAGTSANFARADHVHTIPTAIVVDIGSANAQGSSISFAKADHVHKGVHSVNANAGAQRFGDLSLNSGIGISVVDDGAGNFTFNTTSGDDEFVITSTAGLQINYTGGKFVNGVNGAVVTVPDGNVVVTANTTLGYLYVAVNALNNASATVVASATPPGIGFLPFAQYTSGPSTITAISDTRSFVNTAPLIHSLRVYYTGSGLVVNYNSSDVRINGVFTSINAGTITLTNAVALGAIYVDAGTNTVTANTTGTFPPNCTPLATYTTSGGNVTALNLVRAYINNNIVFGLSSDIANLTPNLAASAGSTNKYADAGHIHDVPTAAPANQTIAAAAADGSAATFSRSDHLHTFTTAVATSQTPNQANAAGTSTSFARADHVHNVPTAAPANQTIAAAASDGSAATFSRSDHLHTFTTAAAVTQNTDQANAAGTSTSFARADHIHNVPTATAVGLNANSTSTQGASTSFARADHTHAIASGTASTQTPDQANATGTSTNFARADHVHNIPTAAASTVSSNANTQGAAATFARADHTHQLTSGSALLDHVPQYDGTNWQAAYPEAALVPGRAWYKQDDFLSNSGGSTSIIGELTWSVTTSGGGSTVATNTAQLDSNHPGIIRITSSGGAGNSAGMLLNPNAIVVLGGGILTNEWLIQIPTLATVTNDWTMRIGLGDSTSADFTNGVYFEYTRGTSTNWLIKTANGGTRTSTTTSTSVAGGAWIKLQIVVNAAASSVQYFVNGSSVGTITTNIPTAGTSFAAHQTRTAGTPVGYDIDYFNVYQRFTTAR